MDRERVYNLESIGNIVVRKNKRNKRLSIRIKPDLSVVVTIPIRCSYSTGKEFAKSKTTWIEKHLAKIKENRKAELVFDETVIFKTRDFYLKILRDNSEKIKTKIKKPVIEIVIPYSFNIADKFVQDTVKSGIAEALRIEAKEHIPLKVKVFAQNFNFNYNKLFFKNVKTRWGSCSVRNNLNFNIHLMRLPERLIDYVILHELTHTVHKNHSKKFWNALEKILPNAKTLDKELNLYSSQRY